MALGGNAEKPFATLLGTVRSASRPEGDDPFIDKLVITSGRGLLLKEYEFTVAK